MMGKRSPRWTACTDVSGVLFVSPRLRPLYARAVDILEDEHQFAVFLFEAIVNLLAVEQMILGVPGEELGRA
jgi:hypothetical protein